MDLGGLATIAWLSFPWYDVHILENKTHVHRLWLRLSRPKERGCCRRAIVVGHAVISCINQAEYCSM